MDFAPVADEEDDILAIEIAPILSVITAPETDVAERPAVVLRLLSWCLFGVAFAWVPFIVSVLAGSQTASHVSWTSVFAHGDLLLVSAVITAGALGDLIVAMAGDHKRGKAKLPGQPPIWVFTAGLLTLNFALSAMYYSVVQFQANTVQAAHVTHVSVILFIFAFVVSLCAILQTEMRPAA